jgi:DNA replication and repair protein RecF
VRLTHLKLRNFRNYASLDLPLGPGLTVLHGPNAQGKTNVLEAIYLLALGSSYRTTSDRELIHWQAEPEERLARVEGEVASEQDSTRLEVVVSAMPGVATKRAFINGAGKRVADLLGRLPVVFFGPEELDLVVGPPGHRRRFLDDAISQLDSPYHRALQQYGRAHHQRNQLLKLIREGPAQLDELPYWDDQLVELGSSILIARGKALVEIAPLMVDQHRGLTVAGGEVGLSYETKLYRQDGGWQRLAEASTQEVQAEFRRCLALERERELAQGTSVVGPHRDDLLLTLDGRPIDAFGSRGQQRTAALALKLAEVAFVQARAGEQPVLLLDDVLSELDAERRRLLAARVHNFEQALLTATDPPPVEATAVYRVRGGQLIAES